jgi:hypothetical protein
MNNFVFNCDQKHNSKSAKYVSQADNQLHGIIQEYMIYIEENNRLHALLLKIMTEQFIFTPTSKNHT